MGPVIEFPKSDPRLLAADKLHSACKYLAGQFATSMTVNDAVVNFQSRAILAQLQNEIVNEAEEMCRSKTS